MALALRALVVGLLFVLTNGSPLRITAMAVNMASTIGPATQTVEIVVNRWSSDAERDRLLAILKETGQEKLLKALRETPKVGYIRTPDSIGYDLHFARRMPGGDGGERIVLGTDRPIGFWEAATQPRSIDYPFTVIEIRVNPDGTGEGKMSVATKITASTRRNEITLEDYSNLPVRLQAVRVEPK